MVESASAQRSAWVHREVAFAAARRLGLAAVHLQGAPMFGQITPARRERLDPHADYAQPGQSLRSGRRSLLNQAAADRVLAFLQRMHAEAMVRRREVLDRALRLALAKEGVLAAEVTAAACGLDVRRAGRQYAVHFGVRPARTEDFMAVDARIQTPATTGVLAGPEPLTPARKALLAWLVGRSGVHHSNEGRLTRLARAMATGAPLP